MEEFKSNSHKAREQQQGVKKVAPVVTGSAKAKKKTDIQKFVGGFASEGASNIGSYVLMDVILPATKRVLEDVIVGSLRMFLYGDSGRSKSSGSGASKVSYRSFYEREGDRRRDNAGPSRIGSGFDYDEIIFDTRGDAELVLNEMDNIIEQYNFVSVADLYDLANVSTTNYAIHRYGWASLTGARVVPIRDGFVIKLPKAVPIDR